MTKSERNHVIEKVIKAVRSRRLAEIMPGSLREWERKDLLSSISKDGTTAPDYVVARLVHIASGGKMTDSRSYAPRLLKCVRDRLASLDGVEFEIEIKRDNSGFEIGRRYFWKFGDSPVAR